MELRALTETGRHEVQKLFDRDERVTTLEEATIREHSTPLGTSADVGSLEDALEEIVTDDDVDRYSTTIDARAAEPIREHLDLTRQRATRPGLWHWLAVTQFPEFVYHRWEKFADIEEKFLSAGRDVYSNAIHRLWWGAELTRDDDDYSRTRDMFSNGRLANDVLDAQFARYSSAAKVVVDELADATSDVVQKTTRDVRTELSVYTLELMTDDEIRTLVRRKRRQYDD